MSIKRPPNRRPLAVLGAIVVLAVLVPMTAHALTPSFTDVPEGHPFFDEIEWLAATGVTTGFPDGSFKPNQPVTRQAMSAFMQRLYDVQDDMSWNESASIFSGAVSGTWTNVPGATVILHVPNGVYADITARFSGESLCVGSANQWCSARIVMSKTGFDDPAPTELYPVVGTDFALDYGGLAGTWSGQSMERVGFGTPGATHFLWVQVRLVGATSFEVDDWTFVAETDLQPSDYFPS